MSRDAQPQAAVALFGKKAPAGPKKAAVKPMFGKPKAKPAAKKPVAKKPVAKKPVAKKPAAKPMGVRPMGGAKASSAPPAPKPAVYDRETVGTAGVASIFAGTFLLTLAALPAATEAALEVIGIGYSGYFLYNWVVNPESRGELDKTLTKIDDETGINLKKVASVTGELVADASKALAASAEKSAEASAAAKAAKAKEVKAEAKAAVAAAPAASAAASDAKKTFKEAVKEAVKDAEK